MDKEKELELKKLEIEKLKIKEGLFRTIVLIILTVGAGFGTTLYKTYKEQIINEFVLVVLATIFVVFFFLGLSLWFSIRKKLKEL
jgi:uncharacterized protein YacL